MAKNYTFPIILDNCLSLDIASLNKNGNLKLGHCKNSISIWSRGENDIAKIGITVNTQSDSMFIVFDYLCDNVPIKYWLELVAVPSNIGKGLVWYFICRVTNRRCKKLHLINGYFVHRTAYKNAVYSKQTASRSVREFGKCFSKLIKRENAIEYIQSKKFKMTYNGKPTKRYFKLINQIMETKTEAFYRLYRKHVLN
ncbi:MAG: hypothetical protein LKG19_15150 [Saprospiraceae bacterium]|jgi:hypothetical protein|nr:hypothetical protein [Saprospiraceae bacterium]